MRNEIIVLGAGACGLMVARMLSAGGKQVRVIEGRARAGGRILTIPQGEFSMRVEAGAEFIHGKLPMTLEILREAGISYHKTSGAIWNVRHELPHKQNDFIEDYSTLTRKLKELTADMSVATFLELNFSEPRYQDLRASVRGYVEGYDLANTEYASALALRDEWTNEDDEDQFRIDDGYGTMISFLQSTCENQGSTFTFNSIIKTIEWKKGEVKITDANGNQFLCAKLIITVPLGILQAEPLHVAGLEFIPEVKDHLTAAKNMGYGQIIKFVLEFNEVFWENKNIVQRHKLKDLGFIFASTEIPTWWTQSPVKTPILTGWFGGPRVNAKRRMNEEALLQIALNNLSAIFHIDHAVLIEKLAAAHVFNWAEDKFSMGGYAYNSLGRDLHVSVLAQSIEQTIYFSGEALSSGPTLGTVESALVSAQRTANEILS